MGDYSRAVDPTDVASTFETDVDSTDTESISASEQPQVVAQGKRSTNQTRAQAQSNQQHIQKFVNQQGTRRLGLSTRPALQREPHG
jgi:hypothetical protein